MADDTVANAMVADGTVADGAMADAMVAGGTVADGAMAGGMLVDGAMADCTFDCTTVLSDRTSAALLLLRAADLLLLRTALRARTIASIMP